MSKEKPHETKCQETTLKNKQRGEGDDGSVGEVLDAKTGVLNSYTHIQYKKKKLGITMLACCSDTQRQT